MAIVGDSKSPSNSGDMNVIYKNLDLVFLDPLLREAHVQISRLKEFALLQSLDGIINDRNIIEILTDLETKLLASEKSIFGMLQPDVLPPKKYFFQKKPVKPEFAHVMKDDLMRFASVIELIVTEMEFLKTMEMVINVHKLELEAILTNSEVHGIFANLDQIVESSQIFLEKFMKLKHSDLVLPTIGQTLHEYFTTSRSLYTVYASNYSNAIALVKAIRSKPEFSATFDVLETMPISKMTTLEVFLEKPIVRVNTYIPILKSLVTFTKNEQEKELFVKVLDHLDETADSVNESVTEQSIPFEVPMGILRIRVNEGRDLKNVDITGISDPCLIVYLGDKEVARTKIISNCLDPKWNEVFEIVITGSMLTNGGMDQLHFEALHSNALGSKFLGKTPSLALYQWIKLYNQKNFEKENIAEIINGWGSPSFSNGSKWQPLKFSATKSHGSVNFQLGYYPIKESMSDCGIVCALVYQGKDLVEEEIVGNFDNRVIFKTDAASPSCHIFYTSNLKDSILYLKAAEGGTEIQLADAVNKKSSWYNLNSKGKIRIGFKFWPTESPLVQQPSIPPLGVVRLNIVEVLELHSAVGLYMKLFLRGRLLGTTSIQNHSKNPRFNNSFFAPAYSLHEDLIIDFYEQIALVKDKRFGRIQIPLYALLKSEKENGGKLDILKAEYNLKVSPKRGKRRIFEIIANIKKKESVEFENESQVASEHTGNLGMVTIEAEMLPATESTSEKLLQSSQCGILRIELFTASFLTPGRYYFNFEIEGRDYFKTLASPETSTFEYGFLNDQFLIDAKEKKVSIDVKTLKGITMGCWKGDIEKLLTSGSKLIITKPSDESESIGSVDMKVSYIPVDHHGVECLPSETCLTIRFSAWGLPSVDTVTDPFIIIRLNGTKVCKTSVQPQTLSPVFNETFKITIHSRVQSILYLICKDHNQLQADVLLGSFTFPLDTINTSGDWIPYEMPLAGCSGEIKSRYRFEAKPLAELGPEHEISVVESTAASNIAKIGKTIQSGVNKILEHGITEHSYEQRKSLVSDEPGTIHSHHESVNIVNSINSGAYNIMRKVIHAPDSLLSKKSVDIGPRVKIEILGAKDLKGVDHHHTSSDPYVRVTIRDEKIHKTAFVLKTLDPVWTNEAFETTSTESITFTIKDKNQVTADVLLGHVKFDIKTVMDDKPVVDSWFPISNGKGSLHLKLEKV